MGSELTAASWVFLWSFAKSVAHCDVLRSHARTVAEDVITWTLPAATCNTYAGSVVDGLQYGSANIPHI